MKIELIEEITIKGEKVYVIKLDGFTEHVDSSNENATYIYKQLLINAKKMKKTVLMSEEI